MKPVISIQFDAMRAVAAKFRREAERIRQVYADLVQKQEVLHSGSWIGHGEKSFNAEMTTDVLPALRRLIEALEMAGAVCDHICQIMEEADQEASDPFHGDGSSPPGGEPPGWGIPLPPGEQPVPFPMPIHVEPPPFGIGPIAPDDPGLAVPDDWLDGVWPLPDTESIDAPEAGIGDDAADNGSGGGSGGGSGSGSGDSSGSGNGSGGGPGNGESSGSGGQSGGGAGLGFSGGLGRGLGADGSWSGLGGSPMRYGGYESYGGYAGGDQSADAGTGISPLQYRTMNNISGISHPVETAGSRGPAPTFTSAGVSASASEAAQASQMSAALLALTPLAALLGKKLRDGDD